MDETYSRFLLKEGNILVGWLIENSYIDESKIHVFGNHPDRANLRLYTSDHCYRITATETYLGCGVTSRRARPGEDQHRGNDLPDGPFTRDTYNRIMSGIVGYELKKIALPVEQEVTPPLPEPPEPSQAIKGTDG